MLRPDPGVDNAGPKEFHPRQSIPEAIDLYMVTWTNTLAGRRAEDPVAREPDLRVLPFSPSTSGSLAVRGFTDTLLL